MCKHKYSITNKNSFMDTYGMLGHHRKDRYQDGLSVTFLRSLSHTAASHMNMAGFAVQERSGDSRPRFDGDDGAIRVPDVGGQADRY